MSNHPEKPKAILFDAYGTLFDVHAIAEQADAMFPGSGSSLAEIWRVVQIDYTRLRTLSSRYRDFRALTEDALEYAAAKLGLKLDAVKKRQLMDQYDILRPFPENLSVLRRLKKADIPLGILSNGTSAMLQSAIASAGMQGLFDHVLSVENVEKFKTAPEAYQLGLDAFGHPAKKITFVSSNGWDACGATWFGYRTFWVNRAAAPLDALGVRPDAEGRSLSDLLTFAGLE